MNQIAAFALPAGLIAYLGFVALAGPARRTTSTALVATAPPRMALAISPESVLIGQDLGRRIRLMGWIGFWLDFVLAFLTAPLLAFGAVGQSISSTVWVSDPIHWGYFGLGLLFASLFLDLFSTIASRRLMRDPASMLGADQSSGAVVSRGRFTRQCARLGGLVHRRRLEHRPACRQDRVAAAGDRDYRSGQDRARARRLHLNGEL